jgi:hypothetical protein
VHAPPGVHGHAHASPRHASAEGASGPAASMGTEPASPGLPSVLAPASSSAGASFTKASGKTSAASIASPVSRPTTAASEGLRPCAQPCDPRRNGRRNGSAVELARMRSRYHAVRHAPPATHADAGAGPRLLGCARCSWRGRCWPLGPLPPVVAGEDGWTVSSAGAPRRAPTSGSRAPWARRPAFGLRADRAGG